MELLTTRQVAERLGKAVSSVARYVELGRLSPAVRGEGVRGPMWFRPEDVDAFAAQWLDGEQAEASA